MTPETAAAIARRIGMTPRMVFVGSREKRLFFDGRQNYSSLRALPRYLASGDRPLRVMESFLSADGSFVVERKEGMVVAIWRPASRFGTPAYGEGDTPAAAIIACAAALEEGDE